MMENELSGYFLGDGFDPASGTEANKVSLEMSCLYSNLCSRELVEQVFGSPSKAFPYPLADMWGALFQRPGSWVLKV